MNTETTPLASDIAEKIKPLVPTARRAYGFEGTGSDKRESSDQINKLIYEFYEHGGRMPDLAKELDGYMSLSAIRRRIRIARAQQNSDGNVSWSNSGPGQRGNRDPEAIAQAAVKITDARQIGGRTYGDAVRQAYDEGLSLKAIADKIGISYYSLWSAKNTCW